MGIGVLDSDFISARDLQIEYFSRTGKEIILDKIIPELLSQKKISIYLNYSNKQLKFSRDKDPLFIDESDVNFILYEPSGELVVSYGEMDNEYTGISPKIINPKNKAFDFHPFNFSAKIAYKQEIEPLFTSIKREHVVLKNNISFSSFFYPFFRKDKEYINSYSFSFYSIYNLLENKFVGDEYSHLDENATLSIDIYNKNIEEFICLDYIYFLKEDIDFIFKLYNSINKNILINKKEKNIMQNKKTKPNKDLSSTKEETYKQIIKGLICMANPEFIYGGKRNGLNRKNILRAGKYSNNAITEKIISALEQLRENGKHSSDIRKDSCVREYLKEIIENLNAD